MTSQDSHPVAYARGVLQVEADTLSKKLDKTLETLEYVVDSVHGGQEWQIVQATDIAQALIRHYRADQ